MTDIDPTALQAWYRDAMRERIQELEALRPALAQQRKAARAEVRSIGHALLGSGGSFGFPEVSKAGKLVEDAPLADLVRRVEGLLSVLRVVAHPERPRVQQRWTWLAATAKVQESVLADATSASEAWDAVADAAKVTPQDLAATVARRFKLEPVELETDESPTARRAATRLVPPATMREHCVLPLREESDRLHVAVCDPTDLELEFRLAEITGRTAVFRVAPPRAILARIQEPDPAAVAARPAPKGSAREAASRGGATVLVVDDSEVLRHMARAVLERSGHAVVEAEDGVDALEHLQSRTDIDLVVVDLQMPRMDGRDFIRTYRGQEKGLLPIIVLTGADDPEVEADLIEAGADDYIRKPLDPRLFSARVTATLRRRGV